MYSHYIRNALTVHNRIDLKSINPVISIYVMFIQKFDQ